MYHHNHATCHVYDHDTSPAVQHAHVLHGDHVPGRHLQPDVVLGVVHDVVKSPHGLAFDFI